MPHPRSITTASAPDQGRDSLGVLAAGPLEGLGVGVVEDRQARLLLVAAGATARRSRRAPRRRPAPLPATRRRRRERPAMAWSIVRTPRGRCRSRAARTLSAPPRGGRARAPGETYRGGVGFRAGCPPRSCSTQRRSRTGTPHGASAPRSAGSSRPSARAPRTSARPSSCAGARSRRPASPPARSPGRAGRCTGSPTPGRRRSATASLVGWPATASSTPSSRRWSRRGARWSPATTSFRRAFPPTTSPAPAVPGRPSPTGAICAGCRGRAWCSRRPPRPRPTSRASRASTRRACG